MEFKFRAIIVDDEKSSRDLISYHLYHHRNIEIVAQCSNPQSAIETIDEKKPDLVFLDIEMPEGNGFEVLKHFKNPTFKTIIITAYNKHAISAVRMSAYDFLMKPINQESLDEVISRFNGDIEKEVQPQILRDIVDDRKLNKIVIRMDGMFQTLHLEDIYYLKAEGAYTFIHCSDTRHLITAGLKYFEQVLPPQMFHRTHKSYIVNHLHIEKVNGGRTGVITMADKSEISVASRRMSIFRHWYFTNAV